MKLSGAKVTDNGEIPENLFFKSAEGARGLPRISQAKGRNVYYIYVFDFSGCFLY